MRPPEIAIGDKVIGRLFPTFVIAEIGINHDGNVDRAAELIDAAASCGADAVKFQTFQADRLLASGDHRLQQQGDGNESAYDLFRRLELSRAAHAKLKTLADRRGVIFLSTPFDEESVDFLDGLGVPAFKIASGDITHLPLLSRVGSKRKPVLLSTGMATLAEVGEALWSLRAAGARETVLLHCISSYPAPPESLNLRVIQTLGEQFDVPVGYSDHSIGPLMPLVALTLGACVIEKHFTMDRNAPGPDHRLSMDPRELRELVGAIRLVEAALGDGRKRTAAAEDESRRLGRRSVVAAVDLHAQDIIQPWMITYKRPGTGLSPRDGAKIIGMRARRDIARDTPLSWDDLVAADSDSQLDLPEMTFSRRHSNSVGHHLRVGNSHA